jgi:hypothetical protein
LDDAKWFTICFSGPRGEANFLEPSPKCLGQFDGDDDGDIDLADFATFQGRFCGANAR